jgi:hypothetical protein
MNFDWLDWLTAVFVVGYTAIVIVPDARRRREERLRGRLWN